MAFHDDLLRRVDPLWTRMLDHPFLIETRDGELDPGVFARWLRQDYLFVRAAVPFLGTLLAKAPPEDRAMHSDAVLALREELELFRERADALGVDLEDVEPGLVNHGYVQFLMATGHGRSYPEAFTVLYGAEKAYHESWKVVEAGLDRSSPWRPLVENWAGDDFAAYVDALEARLDELARGAGEETVAEMEELFELTVRWEIAFWEMAHDGAGWPGIDAGEAGSPPATGKPANTNGEEV